MALLSHLWCVFAKTCRISQCLCSPSLFLFVLHNPATKQPQANQRAVPNYVLQCCSFLLMDFEHQNNRGWRAGRPSIVLSALATIAVTLRFITRRRKNFKLELDDWLALAALVSIDCLVTCKVTHFPNLADMCFRSVDRRNFMQVSFILPNQFIRGTPLNWLTTAKGSQLVEWVNTSKT